MKPLIYILLMAAIGLSSCYSYRIRVDKSDAMDKDKVKLMVYVSNANQLEYEYKILKFSKNYELVQDSNLADAQILLKELKPRMGAYCATPQVVVSAFTLGFYPVVYRDYYLYEYELRADNETNTIATEVMVDKVVTWFNLLSPKKSLKRAIAKSI